MLALAYLVVRRESSSNSEFSEGSARSTPKLDAGPTVSIEINPLSPSSERCKRDANPTIDGTLFSQIEAQKQSARDSFYKQRNADFFDSLDHKPRSEELLMTRPF